MVSDGFPFDLVNTYAAGLASVSSGFSSLYALSKSIGLQALVPELLRLMAPSADALFNPSAMVPFHFTKAFGSKQKRKRTDQLVPPSLPSITESFVETIQQIMHRISTLVAAVFSMHDQLFSSTGSVLVLDGRSYKWNLSESSRSLLLGFSKRMLTCLCAHVNDNSNTGIADGSPAGCKSPELIDFRPLQQSLVTVIEQFNLAVSDDSQQTGTGEEEGEEKEKDEAEAARSFGSVEPTVDSDESSVSQALSSPGSLI